MNRKLKKTVSPIILTGGVYVCKKAKEGNTAPTPTSHTKTLEV